MGSSSPPHGSACGVGRRALNEEADWSEDERPSQKVDVLQKKTKSGNILIVPVHLLEFLVLLVFLICLTPL